MFAKIHTNQLYYNPSINSNRNSLKEFLLPNPWDIFQKIYLFYNTTMHF